MQSASLRAAACAGAAAMAFCALPACADDTRPAGAAGAGAGAGAGAPAAGPDGQDATLSLGEIVVTGRRLTASDAPALTSVDRLGGDVIARENVDNAWQLLGRMPGVALTSFNQGTTSGKFSLRGFNGEGEVNAVKLLIDGIPSNANDGNMPFIDVIFPLNIASIETVRGTSDPRWGLHAIGGSAEIDTRTGGNGLDARLGYGSDRTVEGQAAAALTRDGFSQNLFGAWRRSDGYRDHASYDRWTVGGKWFYTRPDGGLRLGAIARVYRANADEPGYLTDADARRAPRLSYPTSASDGGTRRVGEYSLHAEVTPAAGVEAVLRAYRNTLDDRRFIRFSAAVPQQERYADEQQSGLVWRLAWQPQWAGIYALTIETGGDYQHQANRSLRWNTADRVRTRRTRDQDFDLDVTGAYVQAVVQPWRWIKLVPALRIDWVGGTLTDALTQQRYAANAYGAIKQPKISVAAMPLAGLTLYANWGRSYQIGVGAGSYKVPPRTRDLAPSINDGWEAGAKFAPGHGLEARIAYWEQRASGEVRRRLNDPGGDYDNVGATLRRGLDLQFTAHPTSTIEAWGAIGWQSARIVTPDPASPDTRGKRIDHVPPYLASAGIAWQATPRARLSLWGSAQGSYYLEKTNSTGRYGDNLIVNAEASYRLTPAIEVQLQLRNLGNRFAEYVWWDGTQALHAPMERRSVFGAVAAHF